MKQAAGLQNKDISPLCTQYHTPDHKVHAKHTPQPTIIIGTMSTNKHIHQPDPKVFSTFAGHKVTIITYSTLNTLLMLNVLANNMYMGFHMTSHLLFYLLLYHIKFPAVK